LALPLAELEALLLALALLAKVTLLFRMMSPARVPPT